MTTGFIKRVHSFQIPEEERMGMLLDKCEAMSVLCHFLYTTLEFN